MKKVGIIKRAFCILLIFLLSINSFAAVVSDNDGSAFITKAEFDSLKNNFQTQIDSYNQSIDSKIDGAIAQYLAGIKLSQQRELPFKIFGVADEILMMNDEDPLDYKYNPTSGTFEIRCERWYGISGSGITKGGRGEIQTYNWGAWRDGDDFTSQNARISGSAVQVLTVDPTNNGHRTIINTAHSDTSDTDAEWVGYTETAQDSIKYTSVYRDYSLSGLARQSMYLDAAGNRVYRYQAKIAPWSMYGYLPDYQTNTNGLYAQFNSANSDIWRAHYNMGTNGNFTEVNAWSSNYGELKNTVVCAWSPTLTGNFTVKDNFAWQRTKNKMARTGGNIYGTTQDWISLVHPTWENTSELYFWEPGFKYQNDTQPKMSVYLMKNYNGTDTDLGGTNQFYLEHPGTSVSSSDTSDAWVPALGFHSGITKWNQVYQNAIKNVSILNADGSTSIKEKVYLTEGLPLLDVYKDALSYEFTLEFDKPVLIDFTLDPEKFKTLNTSGAPNPTGMIDVYVNDSTTPTKHVLVNGQTVIKITIKPEKTMQGTVWMKWADINKHPTSAKYYGNATLKLQNHNTYMEYSEN